MHDPRNTRHHPWLHRSNLSIIVSTFITNDEQASGYVPSTVVYPSRLSYARPSRHPPTSSGFLTHYFNPLPLSRATTPTSLGLPLANIQERAARGKARPMFATTIDRYSRFLTASKMSVFLGIGAGGGRGANMLPVPELRPSLGSGRGLRLQKDLNRSSYGMEIVLPMPHVKERSCWARRLCRQLHRRRPWPSLYFVDGEGQKHVNRLWYTQNSLALGSVACPRAPSPVADFGDTKRWRYKDAVDPRHVHTSNSNKGFEAAKPLYLPLCNVTCISLILWPT